MPNRAAARKRTRRVGDAPRPHRSISLKCRCAPNTAPTRLTAAAFPEATPLNAFVAWNEARSAKDRRYRIICDIHQILHDLGGETCLAHLAGRPLGIRRSGRRIVAAPAAQTLAQKFLAESAGEPGGCGGAASDRHVAGRDRLARHGPACGGFQRVRATGPARRPRRSGPIPTATSDSPRNIVATTPYPDHQARRSGRLHPGARPGAGHSPASRRRPYRLADHRAICAAGGADRAVR